MCHFFHVVVAQTKKNKDLDLDGKISFQEFVGDRARDQSKEWLLSEKERFDSDLDRNKDGSLDDVEIGAWIIPSNDDIAQVCYFLFSFLALISAFDRWRG